VAVVGSNDDERVVELAQRSQMRHGLLDSVIELEQVAKRTVVIKTMHLLVDRSRLCHKEPAFASTFAALVQNVHGLEGPVRAKN